MNNSTKDTCPLHIWKHEVLTEAKVSVAQLNAAVTNERLVRWYQAGEPVWMAAQSVKIMMEDHRIASRAAEHDGRGALRAALLAGMRAR